VAAGRYLPFFFISGLHPVAPHAAAGPRFVDGTFDSVPASTTAVPGNAASGAGVVGATTGVGAVTWVELAAGLVCAVAIASGAGAAESLLVQPFTEITASAARIASKESDFNMSSS
jgi:hypothetical protein